MSNVNVAELWNTWNIAMQNKDFETAKSSGIAIFNATQNEADKVYYYDAVFYQHFLSDTWDQGYAEIADFYANTGITNPKSVSYNAYVLTRYSLDISFTTAPVPETLVVIATYADAKTAHSKFAAFWRKHKFCDGSRKSLMYSFLTYWTPQHCPKCNKPAIPGYPNCPVCNTSRAEMLVTGSVKSSIKAKIIVAAIFGGLILLTPLVLGAIFVFSHL